MPLSVTDETRAQPYGTLAEALRDPCFFLVDFGFDDRIAVFSRIRPEWLHQLLRISAGDLPPSSLSCLPLDAVLGAPRPEAVSPEIQYLFHMPFCGSTLLTRYLERDEVFLIRDPASLDAAFRKRPGREYPFFIHELRDLTLILLNRPLGMSSTVVRTAGYYPAMIGPLVRSATFRKGVVLYSSPEHYLLQVLKSPERRKDVRLLLSTDEDFVLAKTGQSPRDLPDWCVGALFWLRYAEAVLAIPRLRTLDCDAVFENPARAAGRVSATFEIRPSLNESNRATGQRHAKTGQPFSERERRLLLEENRDAYRSELRQAADFLKQNDVATLESALAMRSIE